MAITVAELLRLSLFKTARLISAALSRFQFLTVRLRLKTRISFQRETPLSPACTSFARTPTPLWNLSGFYI